MWPSMVKYKAVGLSCGCSSRPTDRAAALHAASDSAKSASGKASVAEGLPVVRLSDAGGVCQVLGACNAGLNLLAAVPLGGSGRAAGV